MTIGKRFIYVCAGFLLATISLITVAAEPSLYIYSTIDALLAGAYDGDLTVKELSTKGNFGLGTYNHLDGEMVIHAGVIYHVRSDGSVSVADPSDRVPLAYVVPFQPTETFSVESASTLPTIEALADQHISNKNMFYAIEIKGSLTTISTRAIAAQSKPYRPLAEVSKTQAVFNRDSVSGTLVGIRSPSLSKGISVPGYHWHFISDDKKYGGHVLSAELAKGVAKLALVRRLEIELPATEAFASADQDKDRGAELRTVEGAKH
ncbi:MAG: acetolactate decarboxylase [Pseudomonadota bacterium]